MVRRCPESSQAVVRGRQPAQFLHGSGRHTVSRDALRDAVTENGRGVMNFEQIETTEYRTIAVDEHVVDALPLFLLGEPSGVLLGEAEEEPIAAVGDESGEIRTIRQFEGQDCLSMVSVQTLQFWHERIIDRRRTPVTLVSGPDGLERPSVLPSQSSR